jgi:hypothetical protein
MGYWLNFKLLNFKPETNFCKFALSHWMKMIDKIKEYIGEAQAFSR